MRDEAKTREQLIAELTTLRQRVGELKISQRQFESSEKALRILVENSLQGLVIVQDFRIIFANNAFSEISGYTVKELLSLSPEKVKAIIHPEDQALVWGRSQDRLEGKAVPPRYEYRGVRKDGSVCWVEMIASRIECQGRPAIQGAIIDITDHKQAVEALRESEEKYRSLVESIEDSIYLVDKDCNYLYMNNKYLSRLGVQIDQVVGKAYREFHTAEGTKEFKKKVKGVFKMGQWLSYEYRSQRDKGYFIRTLSPVKEHKTGKPIAVTVISKDITEYKRAEVALRESEVRFRTLFEAIPEAVLVHDDKGNIQHINDIGAKRLEWSVEDLVGKNLQEIVTSENINSIADHINKARTRGSCRFETTYVSREGRQIIAEVNERPIEFGGRNAILSVSRDITERKRSEDALRESEERFRKLADEASFEGIVIHDGHKILDVNKTFSTMYGYEREELIGMDIIKTIAPEYHDIVSRYILTGYEKPYETVAIRKDGSTFINEVRAKPIPFHGRIVSGVAVRDITERKRAEEELREEALIYENIHDGIIVTDLEGNIIRWNQAAERMFGYLHDEVERKTVGVMTTSIIKGTLHSGRWSGELKFTRKDGAEGICETIVVPLYDEQNTITAVFGVCRDITERKQAEKELKKSFDKLQRALEETVGALASAVEMRDPYTAGHQRRVAYLAENIASEMGLSEHQIEGIRLAGLIHDLGKINVPAEILSKPGFIKELEFSIIKTHPQTAYEILKEVDFPWPVAQIVLQHHERLDGTGYPLGIKGKEIILEARILAVADVVEAMASHRPYRPSHGIKRALEEVLKNREVLYDPGVVDICLRLFYEKGFALENVI